VGGVWTWRVDYLNTTGTSSLPPSSQRWHVNETVQADALLIVEQIRDYKDVRYAFAFACQNPRDSNPSLTAERDSAPFWMRSQTRIRSSTSHKS